MEKQILLKYFIALILIITSIHRNARSQETGILTDNRDGQTYKTVTIGKQTWMAENLNYVTAHGSWCYNNDSNNCKIFGRLYNWETAKTGCPSGWHIPTKGEFDSLVSYLGGEEIAGAKLKSDSYWATKHDSISGYAHVADCAHGNMEKHDSVFINSSNFNGLPGGGYYIGNVFDYQGIWACWWSISVYNPYKAYYFNIFDRSTECGLNIAFNTNGFSVRCIKD
ncbi:MAG TPA: FISUMP domain-containing protein [Bacteroidales bacterium]|nr:FISUMP domain-containing protein [Bacteroidales bacterium]HPS18478.1 FISUMP domain-containing protein [Bacteroidales bacterium]